MLYFDTKVVNKIQSIGYKSHSKFYRFYLSIETNCLNSDVAIVIMKNPSNACIKNLCINGTINPGQNIESDATINNVIKKLSNAYRDIIVLNLYPIMSPNPKVINRVYQNSNIAKTTSAYNRNTIIQTIKQNRKAKIFCAWGQNSSIALNEYADKVCEFLKYCFKKNIPLGEFSSKVTNFWQPLTQIFPPHASKWK